MTTSPLRFGRRLVVVRRGPGGKTYAGRAVLAHRYGVPEITIRRHCRVVEIDQETQVALYDADEVLDVIERLRLRPDLISKPPAKLT